MADVAATEQLLRIIQSLLSPKVEPFKMWLVQIGRERIKETINISLAVIVCGMLLLRLLCRTAQFDFLF